MRRLTDVIDYAAMGKPTKPRMLHRPDCKHPFAGTPFRRATPAELKRLHECADCARRQSGE
jgi:hypothetical protein